MLLSRSDLCLLCCLGALPLGACAEGSKIEAENDGASGGGRAGAKATAIGGSPAYTPGGTNAKGGATWMPVGMGGAASAAGGAGQSTAAGGVFANGGAESAATTVAASTVAGPSSGLGIKVVQLTLKEKTVTINLQLVNTASSVVVLTTAKIRYYYSETLNETFNPKYELYYASNNVNVADITRSYGTIDSSEANRYVELSLPAVTLASTGTDAATLTMNGSFHDSGYTAAPDVSNDYSYVPAVGWCEKITVHVDNSLVWGVAPGMDTPVGSGGSGAGGETQVTGAGGSSSVGAGTGNSGGTATGTT